MTRGLLVGVLAAWQAAFPAVSEAGPLLDWLFHRERTAYALVCPAPATTACAPVVQDPCNPCAAAATTAYSAVVSQPVVAARPALINNVPAFQTVQAQVPVSVYRPTVAYSPTLGAAAPAVSGCQLVQVQTQRRAAWWDPLGLFTPRAAVSPYPINVQYPTTVAMPAVTAAPATTVLPAPAAVTAPAFAAPASSSCAGCATTAPAYPAVPSATVAPGASILGSPPAATYPAPSGTGGAVTTPADQPPSLNAPPQGSYQGSSYRAAPAAPITPPQSLAPPANGASSSSAKPPSEAPAPQPDARQLQLIPYPGDGERPAESSAPPLLNPRAKTASFRREAPWSYTPISWPEASEVRQASAAAPTPSTPAPQLLDDGGWRPARGRQ